MNKPLSFLLLISSLLLFAIHSHAQISISAQVSRDTICRGEQVNISATVNTSNSLVCGVTQFVCGGNPLVVDSIAPERLLQQGYAAAQKTIYGTFYNGYRMQFLYRAEEIANIFGQGGIIQSLGWQIGAYNSSGAMRNFTLKIGCISNTQDTLTTWETGLSTVYGNTAYVPIHGWNNHVLQQPYYWDGSSNLVIEVSHYDNISQGNQVNYIRYSNLPGTVLFTSSNSDITQDNSITPIKWHERPNLILKGCSPTPDPSAQFFWFKNDSLIESNTQTIYDYPQQTSLYSMMAVYQGDTAWSNPVTVFVKQPIPISFSPSNDTVVCSDNMSVTLLADNLYSNYQWSNGAHTPSITVTNTGNYSLTATDSLGCVTSVGPVRVSQFATPSYTIQQGEYCHLKTQVSFYPTDANYIWSNGETGAIKTIWRDNVYTVTATSGSCSDTINLGFIATADTLENSVLDLFVDTDMGYYHLETTPSNFPNYIFQIATNTVDGPFEILNLTIGTRDLPCNIYKNKYVRVITTNNVCIDTTYWQFLPECFPSSVTEPKTPSISLYPNPTNTFIEIQIAEGKLEETMIVDAFGKICVRSFNNRIDVSALAAGIYFVAVKTDMGYAKGTFTKY